VKSISRVSVTEGKSYIIQMVHELKQFALWKFPEAIDVLLIMKELVELIGI